MTERERYIIKARQSLAQKRAARKDREDQLRAELFAKNPRLAEIENELASLGSSVVKSVVSGEDEVLLLIEGFRLRAESLTEERRQILQSLGYGETVLDRLPICPLCKDSGIYEGSLCTCVKQEARRLCFEDLNRSSPLSLSRFSDFSLDYYPDTSSPTGKSPRRRMEEVLCYCKGYAREFTKDSPNLLFFGKTGLGKTHLSLAIARQVIEKGYFVLYLPCQTAVDRLEREKFRSEESCAGSFDQLTECDLLVLDDLGTEFLTSFTQTSLYNLINSRLLRKLPTILNTNLTLKELNDRYGERLTSRIGGAFTEIYFDGEDVRLLKKRAEHISRRR